MPERQQGDRPDLHERREVVARREQHPDRQHRRREAVDDQADHERLGIEREEVGQRAVGLLHPAAGDDREEQQRHADGGGLDHLAGPQHAHVEAHEERDRDRHRDRERAPGRGGERLHDDQREDREQDDHDREDRDQGGHAADRADLVARHLPEALAVPAHREEQDHHVLHGAGEDDADDDPDRARQEAHLGGQHRADERAGAGDRREVVPEQDAPVGGLVVVPVVEPLGGRGALVVGAEHLLRDEARVEAVRDRVRAERGEEQPDRADLLAARQRQDAPGHRAEQRHAGPDDDAADVDLPASHLEAHASPPSCSASEGSTRVGEGHTGRKGAPQGALLKSECVCCRLAGAAHRLAAGSRTVPGWCSPCTRTPPRRRTARRAPSCAGPR